MFEDTTIVVDIDLQDFYILQKLDDLDEAFDMLSARKCTCEDHQQYV